MLKLGSFLENKKPRHFCGAFFKLDVKCDLVDNNMAKIFSGFIIKAKFKLVVNMLEEIHKLMMKYFLVLSSPKA